MRSCGWLYLDQDGRQGTSCPRSPAQHSTAQRSAAQRRSSPPPPVSGWRAGPARPAGMSGSTPSGSAARMPRPAFRCTAWGRRNCGEGWGVHANERLWFVCDAATCTQPRSILGQPAARRARTTGTQPQLKLQDASLPSYRLKRREAMCMTHFLALLHCHDLRASGSAGSWS